MYKQLPLKPGIIPLVAVTAVIGFVAGVVWLNEDHSVWLVVGNELADGDIEQSE